MNCQLQQPYAIVKGYKIYPGANLYMADLAGADLSSMWSGEDHISLDRADLRRANLSGANLRFTSLQRADMTQADFSGASLRGASMVAAALGNSYLCDAHMVCARLICADLRYARLERANLTDADLRNARLHCANLTYANLTGVCLRGADLTGALGPHGRIATPEVVKAALAGAPIEEILWLWARSTRASRQIDPPHPPTWSRLPKRPIPFWASTYAPKPIP